jgi:adenine-specific DNA-methyltransferase
MNSLDNIPLTWSTQFGLATSPLFEGEESAPPGKHCVLLDGGYGTFSLSTSEEELWRVGDVAAWAWSGNIPHHVTVTPEKVAVVRWDRPNESRVYGRSSVERSLERFYAYLNEDRLRSNKTVVDHLLGFFRRVRALGHEANIPDSRTTDIFASALAHLIAPHEVGRSPHLFGLSDDAIGLYARINATGLAAAIGEIERASGSLSLLKLHPALAVRHAGGQLFQEAHFELIRGAPGFDLFGLIGAPEVQTSSRGGTHFTPPALARSIVEQVLSAIRGLSERKELTVCDPACGSGAFLHEAFRALRRLGFDGHLRLIGSDISPAAVAMARFVLAAAMRDWAPEGGVELDLKVGDSLGELGMPKADVVVMNPPFIAFGAQTPDQREQLRAATDATSARGDYCMAFIVRALEALNLGGAIGTLFPSSLLSLKAAGSWRERLLELGNIRLLASIGDFGLFTHAMVQVACAVIEKSSGVSSAEFTAVVTENDSSATSAALRQLRKLNGITPAGATLEEGWNLFPVPSSALRSRPTWRLSTPRTERIIRTLTDALLPTVSDLFDVAQGVQTGLNDVLLLTIEEWRLLPSRERGHFRLATMTDSIQGGQIAKPYRVFFPHTKGGAQFADEAEVERAVPTYFAKYLLPNRDRLSQRASIVQTRRPDWWGLMRSRAWAYTVAPRIISKFFAAEGGFAADVKAEYIPVMGHVWLPKPILAAPDEDNVPLSDLIYAYAAFLNSAPFIKLLSLYAPHVAGGQFDVSSRHVGPISLPNLREISLEPGRGHLVLELAKQGKEADISSSQWRAKTTELVIRLYGTPTLANL